MIIAIGCDHIVTDTKIKVSDYLKSKGHTVLDVGTYDFTRTHYPIYGKKVAELVTTKQADLGITICGTGVGITTSANKVAGIRAPLVRDVTSAMYAKKELNANILGLGAKVLGDNLIYLIIDKFIETKYIETPENKILIKKIAQLEEETKAKIQLVAEDLFAEEIAKWEQGVYHD